MPKRTRGALRIGLIGWGAINRRVVELLSSQLPERFSIEAIAVRDRSKATQLPPGAKALFAPDEMNGLDLDLVLEAASREAVALWGESALRASRGVVVASTSAFCDDALLERLVRLAEELGSRIIVPGGALAGIDALGAASALPLDSVVHTIVKPPIAWRGTEAEALIQDLQGITSPTTIFSGSAREVARRFPKNANAAVITALAGVGLDKTRVELTADPNAAENVHRLRVSGAFGKLEVSIENRPLAANPKSSEMAALSMVRIVRNHAKALSC